MIDGGLPDMSMKRFLENFPEKDKNVLVEILRLVMGCVELLPSKRTTISEMIDTLKKIKLMLSEKIKQKPNKKDPMGGSSLYW